MHSEGKKIHEKDNSQLFAQIEHFSTDHLTHVETEVHSGPVVDDHSFDDNITGPPTAEEVIEYFDDEETLKKKAVQMAQMIKDTKSFVVYTGAGISTAAKIPDYRGPKGVWTLKAKGRLPEMKITLEQALPTYSHMALVTLAREGMLSHVVSTNVDGLHRRSGFEEDEISELHGNIYREYCNECGAEYLRPFDVTKSSGHQWKRFTGRLCEKEECRGKLRDSIVNFGENLPEKELSKAQRASEEADVTLVIGSSMRVTPACDLPSYSYSREKGGGKFSILNLQKTPYDGEVEPSGGVRIFARCDEFMKLVMQELGLHGSVEYPFELKETDLEATLANIITDDSRKGEIMTKYNVYSMADDGPPPEGILSAIRDGGFCLRKVKHVKEKNVLPSQKDIEKEKEEEAAGALGKDADKDSS